MDRITNIIWMAHIGHWLKYLIQFEGLCEALRIKTTLKLLFKNIF